MLRFIPPSPSGATRPRVSGGINQQSRSNASSHVLVHWKSKYFGSSPGSNTMSFAQHGLTTSQRTLSVSRETFKPICLFHSIGSNTTLFRMCMENQCLYGSLIYLKCQELIASYLYNSFHLELSLKSISMVLLFCLLCHVLTFELIKIYII